ncbi:DUF2252 domain-containing protein [Spirosoma horti]
MQRKYAAMRKDPFRFFRGTSHLFNHDIPADSFLWNAPNTWNVGDLHIENFGSFKADNRVTYFDLNDFDECILAPNLTDLARLICSLFVAADDLKLSNSELNHLARTLTDAYAVTLSRGYVRQLEQDTATGIIRDLLRSVECRKRHMFLENRVAYKKRSTQFRKRILPTPKIDQATKIHISNTINGWAESQPDPRFFSVLDVARRVAGTGSLGIERFMILVRGLGRPGKEYLLDLKKARPSTLQAHLAAQQPFWFSEAERIVEIQKRVQGASPALLHPLMMPDGTSYVLRELQPSEDKIILTELIGKVKKLENLVGSLGRLCAWGHLRSSGRQGSAIADELIAFGLDYNTWRDQLIEYARQYARQVKTDYAAYCSAYDDGYFNV